MHVESISASPPPRRCSGENTPKRKSGGFPPVRGLAWRRGPATPAAAVGLPCPKTKARRVPPGRLSCVWRLASRQTRGARRQTKTKDRRVSPAVFRLLGLVPYVRRRFRSSARPARARAFARGFGNGDARGGGRNVRRHHVERAHAHVWVRPSCAYERPRHLVNSGLPKSRLTRAGPRKKFHGKPRPTCSSGCKFAFIC